MPENVSLEPKRGRVNGFPALLYKVGPAGKKYTIDQESESEGRQSMAATAEKSSACMDEETR